MQLAKFSVPIGNNSKIRLHLKELLENRQRFVKIKLTFYSLQLSFGYNPSDQTNSNSTITLHKSLIFSVIIKIIKKMF